jgi:hypothetical protein
MAQDGCPTQSTPQCAGAKRLSALAVGDPALPQSEQFEGVVFRFVVKHEDDLRYAALKNSSVSTRTRCFVLGNSTDLVPLMGRSTKAYLQAVGWSDDDVEAEVSRGKRVGLLAWETTEPTWPATWSKTCWSTTAGRGARLRKSAR